MIKSETTTSFDKRGELINKALEEAKQAEVQKEPKDHTEKKNKPQPTHF